MTKKRGPSFYDTKEWRTLRYAVYRRDVCLCQDCGVVVIGQKWVVDHTIERPVGVMTLLPKYDRLDNLRLLCFSCHNRKTFSKVQEVNENGFPVGSDWE